MGTTEIPKIFIGKSEIKQRLYNGKSLMVWEGKVKISDIQGWVENPRIELIKKNLLSVVGNRDLTQDEIFDLMKNDRGLRLKELRDDIMRNGLREPLTLTCDGKLLDGNRRFFALRYALEGKPANQQDLEIVNAFVLEESATDEDEQNVLVEENFSPSLKIEWPDYVKALKIVEAHNDGFTVDEIAKKFSWSRPKIRDTLLIQEIINEFLAYATSPNNPDDEDNSGLDLTEQEAEAIVSKNYQYFNEAKKSFLNEVKTNFKFKIQFFDWIHGEKFSSFPEVRIAYKAWNDPEARAAIMQEDKTAAKNAKAIIDYNSRVGRNTEEAIGRIQTFANFLKDMTADEINALPKASRDNLEAALEMVLKMSKAASE